ncbi:probable methyltransferase-like protein 24 [Palaemon carinicauda]|uniref:probable methyltransferase-like protein 24 n=1 Tax=Palaemon carinicauda TaxID=392227 RepID=UPI0035B613F0
MDLSRRASGTKEALPGASRRKKPHFYYNGLQQFLDYAENPRVRCPEMRYLGGHRRDSGENDGKKAVCFAPLYNITPGNCLVYSFGISIDWSFDDAIAGYGCKVFSFDPTIKLPDHKRSDGVHFYNLGIGAENQTVGSGKNKVRFMSLSGIMDMLGHTHEIIDYVKLDIESMEAGLIQALTDDPQRLLQIKQLGMEIHPNKYFHEDFYNLFVSLEYLGFTTFDTRPVLVQELLFEHPDFPGHNISTCYEMAFAQVEYSSSSA